MRTSAARTRVSSKTLTVFSVVGFLLAAAQPACAQADRVTSAQADTAVSDNDSHSSATASDAPAQTNGPAAQTPGTTHPEINWFYRSQEDWSVLADPALRTIDRSDQVHPA